MAPLVQKWRAPEDSQEPDPERAASGVAAGPFGQGNPYLFRDLDRATADLRLARFNPDQIVHRHRTDPNRNITLLQCVDQLVLRNEMGRPRGTVVVDNTLAFRSILFEEYGTNLRTWPSLQRGVFAPGCRQYVEESSPESEPELDSAPPREIIVLGSSSSGGRAPLEFIFLMSSDFCFCLCMYAIL